MYYSGLCFDELWTKIEFQNLLRIHIICNPLKLRPHTCIHVCMCVPQHPLDCLPGLQISQSELAASTSHSTVLILTSLSWWCQGKPHLYISRNNFAKKKRSILNKKETQVWFSSRSSIGWKVVSTYFFSFIYQVINPNISIFKELACKFNTMF